MKMHKWMVVAGFGLSGILAGGAAFAQRAPRLNPFTTTTTTTATTETAETTATIEATTTTATIETIETATIETVPAAGTAVPTASRAPIRNPFVPPPRSPFRL